MCSTKMPGPPAPVAAPPAAPMPMAQILKPSRARVRQSQGNDVLSELRIPLKTPTQGQNPNG